MIPSVFFGKKPSPKLKPILSYPITVNDVERRQYPNLISHSGKITLTLVPLPNETPVVEILYPDKISHTPTSAREFSQAWKLLVEKVIDPKKQKALQTALVEHLLERYGFLERKFERLYQKYDALKEAARSK